MPEMDFEKYRLRTFVNRLMDMGEVEVREDHVPLTRLSEIIEASDKSVLFKQAGPERVEMISAVAGGRKRLAAAFGVSEDKLYDTYYARKANPLPVIEVPSDEAPVHAIKITGKDIDLTRLPFHPQHEFDGSCYISSAIDYTIDPVSGRTNSGCRRLSLRNRTQTGTNVTAPSDLKRIYTAAVARGEKLPITFTVGSHTLDFIAATERTPGDELTLVSTFRGEKAAVVKSLTNDIRVPADAEMILEGYLDERGYVEPEGPFGEYMGYYGAIHLDPVFHCTAITMRRDTLHQTLLHGSAYALENGDSPNISALRMEAEAWKILKATVREPLAVHLKIAGASTNHLRVSLRQHMRGEAKRAIAALFGGIPRIKHVWVFDEDVDVTNDMQCEWAFGTRFQADEDVIVLSNMSGMTMDPSLNGRKLGSKGGFDCTRPFGVTGQIPYTRCAAKTNWSPTARFQTVEQALESGPHFYAALVEAVGSQDGREVACALDELRQKGKLGRDRDGRYHLAAAQKGMTGIVGELYHDPNDGA